MSSKYVEMSVDILQFLAAYCCGYVVETLVRFDNADEQIDEPTLLYGNRVENDPVYGHSVRGISSVKNGVHRYRPVSDRCHNDDFTVYVRVLSDREASKLSFSYGEVYKPKGVIATLLRQAALKNKTLRSFLQKHSIQEILYRYNIHR